MGLYDHFVFTFETFAKMCLEVAIEPHPSQAGSVPWVLTEGKGSSLVPQKRCFSALWALRVRSASILVSHTLSLP